MVAEAEAEAVVVEAVVTEAVATAVAWVAAAGISSPIFLRGAGTRHPTRRQRRRTPRLPFLLA